MKIIEQSWEWVQKPIMPLETIEMAGRTCYKSEDQITKESAEEFVRMIVKRGHESVVEHVSASVRFITNRGVTHELVRHRLCAFSQESTRYVNYGESDIQFIRPVWIERTKLQILGIENKAIVHWVTACDESETQYNLLLSEGWRPEQARDVLPNSLKTEIVVTANLREWRHIFKLRTSKAAHPQIRMLMLDCLEGFQKAVPVIFEDLQ